MAKYRVLQPSYIANRIVPVGEVVDIEFAEGGKPGDNLEAVAEDGSPLPAGLPADDGASLVG